MHSKTVRGLSFIALLFLALFFYYPAHLVSTVYVGTNQVSITPPIGTPSAGYEKRQGRGMEGVHDPLLATAMVIDNGEVLMAFCGVDHLGFTHEMTQAVIQKVQSDPLLATCQVFIGSSHTHSGGGAYLDIPFIGEVLAGRFDPVITQFYIDQIAQAIISAGHAQQPAKIGIGYGTAKGLTAYRGAWPLQVNPLEEIAVIKATTLDNTPLVVFFSYALHPTILKYQNLEFSADFVGYAREALKELIGSDVQPIYFNGAQGDLIPSLTKEGLERLGFESSKEVGDSLAHAVKKVWDSITPLETLKIEIQKKSYTFEPKATPQNLKLPIESYATEINLITFNDRDAFITIPGELSSVYEAIFKQKGEVLGYAHVSILGLVNDAHGYIILPESWRRKTFESTFSFGGEFYGDFVESTVEGLMEKGAKHP